ncbi:MAG: hypothetical protein AB1635_20795, partial [Acidobacteriota bacterium]
PAPPAAAAPAVPTLEPFDGAIAGHFEIFRWQAVEGADSYRVRITATTDGRTVWDSPPITATETKLPNTVAMEPEAYVWQVTAFRGTAVVSQSAPSRFTITP